MTLSHVTGAVAELANPGAHLQDGAPVALAGHGSTTEQFTPKNDHMIYIMYEIFVFLNLSVTYIFVHYIHIDLDYHVLFFSAFVRTNTHTTVSGVAFT